MTKTLTAAAIALSLLGTEAALADQTGPTSPSTPILTTKDVKAPVKWDVGDLRISIPGVF